MSAAPLPRLPSSYADIFRRLAPQHDPRHVEAYIRLQYSTLSHLSEDVLRAEAGIADHCIRIQGTTAAEELAQSFGL